MWVLHQEHLPLAGGLSGLRSRHGPGLSQDRKGAAMPGSNRNLEMAIRRLRRWSQQDKKYCVVGHDGLPCPRCRQPMEIREHVLITKRHLQQPYYFSRWFYCRNPRCPVTLHLSEAFKVRRLNNEQTSRTATAAEKTVKIERDQSRARHTRANVAGRNLLRS